VKQDGQDRESGASARRRRHLRLSAALGALLATLLWRPVTVLSADPPGHDHSSLRLNLFRIACAPWSSMHGRATDRPQLSGADHDWDANTQRAPRATSAYFASVSPGEEQESNESLPDPPGVIPIIWWLPVPAAHLATTTDSGQSASLVLVRASSRAPPSVFA
jgi:hypothetical protein